MRKWAAALSLLAIGPSAAVADERPWTLLHRETFEAVPPPGAPLHEDVSKESDPYSDDGAYFRRLDPRFEAPMAYRGGAAFGQNGWLRIERYTRSKELPSSAQYEIVTDPADQRNHVLAIKSPEHTDGVVIRSSRPLPPEYRICVKGGHADFGTGRPGDSNGYRGDERAEPWLATPSIHENGLYWLSILDAEPRPRNNVWIHHHRKAVIDSDNNWYPEKDGGSWSRIFDGKGYQRSGEHPVMMFVFDSRSQKTAREAARTGPAFISWSEGRWNPEFETGEIRAVDAYLENTWYDVCIEKTQATYTLSMSGTFKYGGTTSYTGTIERSRVLERAPTPDYFVFGDPHANYYRGHALYDDVRLYVPARRRGR